MFEKEDFQSNEIGFTVHAKPVSAQNKKKDKVQFTKEVHKITSKSEYIITDTCWIHIDYYCQHVRRAKNPGAYDVDNIVKPILDALVGKNALIVDDCIVDRVVVNWIDTGHEEYIEVHLEYPSLHFIKKADLIFFKSKSGWCYPIESNRAEDWKRFMIKFFDIWDSIVTEDDYYEVIADLPAQNFIYYTKIRDKGYSFIEL